MQVMCCWVKFYLFIYFPYSEIDLLKEENSRMQHVVDEKNTRVTELEIELKKLKETNSEKQNGGPNESEVIPCYVTL